MKELKPGTKVRVRLDYDILETVYLTPDDFDACGTEGVVLENDGDHDRFGRAEGPIQKVAFGNITWYIPESILDVVADDLTEYKKLVADTLKKEKSIFTEAEFDYFVDTFGLEEVINPYPEPAPGSVVRHKSMSIAFIRQWGSGQDGADNNWRGTDGTVRSWGEIKNNVVILESVAKGAPGYAS